MKAVEATAEAELLRLPRHPGLAWHLALAITSAILLWGCVALWALWGKGLVVTGVNYPVFWGVLETNFVYFIGISHAGTLISAILRITGAEWRRPITRAAEAITVFALIIGPMNILFHLGRPLYIYRVITDPTPSSPLFWDVCCITTYLVASSLYLYLPLIPDIALLRDRKRPTFSRALGRVYTCLAVGWRGRPEQWRRLERAIAIMAVLVIPIAISVHTVVSWVFSMTLAPMWHSTIFGPYFVVGAIFSGIAAIILAMAIIRRAYGLQRVITRLQFDSLGRLLLTMCCLWAYFTFAEHLTAYYGNQAAEMAVWRAKISGSYAPLFWTMVLLCFVVPFPILAFRRTRTVAGTVIASVAVNIGMWLERYTIVVPTLSHPRMSYSTGTYTPTWVEWSIMAAEFAGMVFLYLIFARIFPVVSIWENREIPHGVT